MRVIISLVAILLLNCIMAYSETYTWSNVAMGGGGFVSSVVTCPTEKNLIYCRTDVGGAYKWNESTTSWSPLLDWVAQGQVGWLGVEALAVDPTTPSKLYMLAGISYFNSGKTVILRSSDYGATFDSTVVTSQFTADANSSGRQTGERLAVDPNKGSILFCGTRSKGLFKSTDYGATWSSVSSLGVTTTSNGNGICFVLFDPTSSTAGNATKTIYVGVSVSGTTNLYVSKDAGSSWSAVTGQTTTYMPHRAVLSDGLLYVTYSDGCGPSNVTAGSVMKFNTSTSTWTTITPILSGYSSLPFAGISVSGDTVIVSTTNRYIAQPVWPNCSSTPYGDRIFLSVNGGSAWTDLIGSSKFAFNNNGISWINDYAIQWAGCLAIDPYNAKRVFVTSGNGVFMTDGLSTTATSTWKFMVKGIEETVPLDILSIPSGPVISVVGDFDGAKYTDITAYPSNHSPRIGTSTGLAFAASSTSFVVRAGGYSDASNFPLYYSSDAGSTWTAFSSRPVSGTYQGKVCVNASGASVLWCPSGYSTTYKTTSKGSSWTTVSGLSISNAIPVADQVNANYIYAYNYSSGAFYVSSNAGTSFSSTVTTTTGESGLVTRTVPGVEGDIWIPLGANGLTRSTNHGTSFSKISTVTTCEAVGFGKAATGATFPTVYVWGKVGGVVGIFRSIDQGASWTRINDDSHEYGGPANGHFVIGDMNTYGRVYMSTAGRGIVCGDLTDASTCAQPSLGTDISICGVTLPVTLSTNTTAQTNVSYTWYRNGTAITGATSATYSLTAASTAAATYVVVRDSASCSKKDTITVTAALSDINLGADVELCSAISASFDAGVTGVTYAWSKDGAVASGETSRTYTATAGGTYVCTISASNCASQQDTVIVTSSLLDVENDTICKAGTATLSVLTSAGSFEWYSAATGGTALATGATYSPSITATQTYYVKDASSVSSTIGKTEKDGDGWETNTFSDDYCGLVVTVEQDVTLASVSVYLQAAGSVTIRMLDSDSSVAYTYTATGLASGLQVIPVDFQLVAGTYTMDAVGSGVSLFLQTAGASFPYSLDGYVSFTNASSWATGYYGMFYSWVLKVGNSCARTPVKAVIDATIEKCKEYTQSVSLSDGWNLVSFYVDPTDASVDGVFGGLGAKLETVKTMDAFYDPSQLDAYNSLLTIVPGLGYYVKVSGSCTLNVTGTLSTVSSYSLAEGWNLVGFPRQSSATIETHVSTISSSLNTIKNFDGFWIPGGSLNSLTSFTPGKGYLVKATVASSLQW